MINISIKVTNENTWHSFQVTKRIWVYDRNHYLPAKMDITPKVGKLQLWFLFSSS